MKATIETLDFTECIKRKLKMKVGTSNLDIKFLSRHIKFSKTNLSIR